MNVLGRIFLNSRKDRHEDRVFLRDVEELTFLISQGCNLIKRSENY